MPSVHTRIELILNFVQVVVWVITPWRISPPCLKKLIIKNINVLSSVKKCVVVQTKNLQIVTRQGTKTGMDNQKIRKIKNKEYYPNPTIQKQLYNDASNIFQETVAHEETDDARQKMSQ